jgi:hypothetical protein
MLCRLLGLGPPSEGGSIILVFRTAFWNLAAELRRPLSSFDANETAVDRASSVMGCSWLTLRASEVSQSVKLWIIHSL